MGAEKSGGEERVAPHPVNAPCSGPRRQNDPSVGDPGLPLTTGEGAALVEELREALDDPKRGEWGGYPWEHLGDAERDVRVLLAECGRLRERVRELEDDVPAF